MTITKCSNIFLYFVIVHYKMDFHYHMHLKDDDLHSYDHLKQQQKNSTNQL